MVDSTQPKLIDTKPRLSFLFFFILVTVSMNDVAQ